MSFAFLVAGFLATTNAGRVALACADQRPPSRSLAIASLAGLGLAAVATALADPLLDALSISPESFRIAAALVLATTGVRTLLWPRSPPGPPAAALVTPELAALAISFGASEPSGKVLGAAALAIVAVAPASALRRREPLLLAEQFLAGLQLVVAVALAVSGVRDV